MITTFDQWKKGKGGPAGTSTPKGPSSSSGHRAVTSPAPQERVTGGVLSYSQMTRMARNPSIKSPSEVGSVRSYRSVMTVEEQVSTLDSKVDALMEANRETQRLLQQLLQDKKNQSKAGPSGS